MLKDIWIFVRPYKGKFWLGSFVRFANDFLGLLLPWIFSEVVTFTSHYKVGDDLHYLYFLGGSALVVGLFHHSFKDLAKYMVYPIAEKAGLDASMAALEHMYRLDSAWHERENSGNKMKRVENGYESINKIVRTYIDLFIESTLNIVFITYVFYKLDLRLNLLFVGFFVTYYFMSSYLTRKAVRQSHLVSQEQEDFNGLSFETLNNIATIKSLGVTHSVVPYLHAKIKQLFVSIKTRVKYFRLREATLNSYQEIFRLIMVGFTVWQVVQGQFEVGIIALVLLYFDKIESSAREFSMVYNEIVIAKIGLERLRHVFDEKPTIEDTGMHEFNTHWKKLTLKDLSFNYGGKEVIHKLSLTIHRGEKIGIVGISGTGKSTLFKLLLKLYNPTRGAVLFDDTPLESISRQSYIDHVAVVPQETELFNFSLKDNVLLSRPQRSNKKSIQARNKQLKTALATAHVTDFISKLPKGIDSLIGEKGIKLSGGERQRVGIARAIMKQPEILLMDEATSHLDSESEEKIQDALEEFFKDITAIVIAHRLSTIRKMDRIIVMHKGAVIESGSFEELLKKEGEFYTLWQRQKF